MLVWRSRAGRIESIYSSLNSNFIFQMLQFRKAVLEGKNIIFTIY